MKKLTTSELRELYLRFFEGRGHKRIASAPLVPENDSSVLFTTAGMHPLVPYLKGQPHPAGRRLTDAQKCLRTTDIDAVGDATHATVFEMLGNWSLGDYFKKEAITWSWEFLTSPQWLGLDPKKLAVSIFAGDVNAAADEEASAIWRAQGLPETRIARLSNEDNWWPAGGQATGPQGPDTEMFYWVGAGEAPEKFDPADKRWVEIWNDVFMQFNRTEDSKLEPLPQKNVDTGMGLERVIMVLNGLSSIYEIDSYAPLMSLLKSAIANQDERHLRILADHIKAVTFILGDEYAVAPSNTERGYVARRLIRRAILALRQLRQNKTASEVLLAGMNLIIREYQSVYPSLGSRRDEAEVMLRQEIAKFDQALDRGLAVFNRNEFKSGDHLTGQKAFNLYQSFGFPLDVSKEVARGMNLIFDASDQAEFDRLFEHHKATSKKSAEQKFAGGLADKSEQSVKYHTATHLLHAALRQVLGEHVKQRGSNINPERLRFDFSHPAKLSPEQIAAVQDLINQKIQKDLPVIREEMTLAEAKNSGAMGLFESKYQDKVSVYTIGNFSKEICGGPHVTRTGELGRFQIKKEESASAGIRRIKAVLL